MKRDWLAIVSMAVIVFVVFSWVWIIAEGVL